SLLICSNFSVNILSSTLPPARKIPGEDVASTSTPVILSSKPAATCAMSSVARISAASCRRELTCMRCSRATFVALVSLISVGFLSCGGSGGESTSQSAAKNSHVIAVTGTPEKNYANGLFTTLTICVPGTSNCQSIPNVLV